MRSTAAWRRPDARVAGLLAMLAAGMTLATALPPGTARAVFMLPILLFLPGYALVAVILGPYGRDRALEAGISAIASIAVYAFLTLALHALSMGVSTMRLAIAVDSLVLLAVVVLVGRVVVTGRRGSGVRARSDSSDLRHLAAPVLIAALAVPAFIAVARVFPSPAPKPFTELTLGGKWSQLTSAPQLGGARRLRVALVLRNETGHAPGYRIVARVEPGTRWASRTLSLPPGATWRGSVAGRVSARRCTQRLIIDLYAVRPARRISELGVPLRGSPAACGRGRAAG